MKVCGARDVPRPDRAATGAPAGGGADPRSDRRVAIALVLGGITSVQFGSALATSIFDEVGPAGTVLLRTIFAAAVLAAVWRPAIAGLSRVDAPRHRACSRSRSPA